EGVQTLDEGRQAVQQGITQFKDQAVQVLEVGTERIAGTVRKVGEGIEYVVTEGGRFVAKVGDILVEGATELALRAFDDMLRAAGTSLAELKERVARLGPVKDIIRGLVLRGFELVKTVGKGILLGFGLYCGDRDLKSCPQIVERLLDALGSWI